MKGLLEGESTSNMENKYYLKLIYLTDGFLTQNENMGCFLRQNHQSLFTKGELFCSLSNILDNDLN